MNAVQHDTAVQAARMVGAVLPALACLAGMMPVGSSRCSAAEPPAAWETAATVPLDGVRVSLSVDSSGKDWQRVDVLAHHNATHPQEPIASAGLTTSYTELAVLDDTHLICVYDRIPHSWSAIPDGSADTNSIWALCLTLEAPGK